MEQSKYEELCREQGAIQLVHPEFDADYHKNKWHEVTILICQRKTFEITRLCIESILRFYPDINILVVDGDSQDESTLYLKYKSLTIPNFKLYERIGQRHSHGWTLHDAITNYIKTPFVLTMDSDTIVNRGGFIEGMLEQFKAKPKLYATGSLMLVSRANWGVGAPQDENDVLRYAHPSCSIFHVNTYKVLKTPFDDNGSPLAANMLAAERFGLEIGAYPVDKYVSHRSGISWVTEHQIVWKDDYNVFIRPFITFLVTKPEHIAELFKQTDRDFNVQIIGQHQSLQIYDTESKAISNPFYQIRFLISGEYVCVLNEGIETLDENFVRMVKEMVIQGNGDDELIGGGLRVVKRNLFQQRECLT